MTNMTMSVQSTKYIFAEDEKDEIETADDGAKRLSRDSEGNILAPYRHNVFVLNSTCFFLNCFHSLDFMWIYCIGETRVTTPTAIESQLPWKRVEEDGDGGALKQNEFPAWASNKEYLAYNSPSATFLGNIVLIYYFISCHNIFI